MQIELRDYQDECVRRVCAAYHKDKNGTEAVILPTGAGKTIVFSSIIHRLNRHHNINTLIIAHRDELLDQAADKYRMIKPDAIIGKVGGGVADYGAEVTVASVATISRAKHLKQLKAIGYGLIIVDEAHHVAADGYQRVLDALPDAFKLFVTATPDRLDGKPLLDKAPIYSASIVDMIERGYLCDVRAIAIRTEVNLDEIKSTAGDFNVGELDNAINTPARNKRVVSAYKEHAEGRRALCFCVTIAHAEALSYAFNDAGIPAGMITGETPREERQRLYSALHDGSLNILCNVQVLTEGFDEPLISCVIMARPTQSRSLFVQCIGRGLRLAPAKKECIILDLTDNCFKHRLKPQKLSSALKQEIEDGESLLEAVTREETEEESLAIKEKQVRKLNERRKKDQVLDLLGGLPDWEELPGGLFRIEVGPQKHRIALIPSVMMNATVSDNYFVVARLAPTFKAQTWMSSQPLDWAQQFAEKQARKLLEDPTTIRLLDKHASWKQRDEPISEKQHKFLDWKKIPHGEGTAITTKAQASEAIDAWKLQAEQKMARVVARRKAKEAQKA